MSLEFKKEHLKHYLIIDKPCTAKVRVANNITSRNLYEEDEYPRYLIPLRVGLKEKLIEATKLLEQEEIVYYKDISDCFITGAIFKDTINKKQLPVKGEEIIATFDYVDNKLLCTSLTLIPRIKLKAFDPDTYNKTKTLFDKIIEKSKKLN